MVLISKSGNFIKNSSTRRPPAPPIATTASAPRAQSTRIGATTRASSRASSSTSSNPGPKPPAGGTRAAGFAATAKNRPAGRRTAGAPADTTEETTSNPRIGRAAKPRTRRVASASPSRSERTASAPPPSASGMERMETIRQTFKTKRAVLPCRSCKAMNTLVLNGAVGTRVTVKCKSCMAKISGEVLESYMARFSTDNDDTGDQSPPEEEQSESEDGDGSWVPESDDEDDQDLGSISGFVAAAEAAEEEMKELKDPTVATLQSENSRLWSHLKEKDAEIAKLRADVSKLTQLIHERLPSPGDLAAKAGSNHQDGPAAHPVTATSTPAVSAQLGQDRPQDGPAHPTPRPTWADIAKNPAPDMLHEKTRDRLAESRRALAAAGFSRGPRAPTGRQGPYPAAQPQRPEPVPVYFGGVPRGPIGALKRALHMSIPKWAVLNLSFVGRTALEILCHKPLVDRLVAGMKLLNFRHLDRFNPLKVNSDGSSASESQLQKIRLSCFSRWVWEAALARSPAAAAWYNTNAERLETEDESLSATRQATLDRVPADRRPTKPTPVAVPAAPDATAPAAPPDKETATVDENAQETQSVDIDQPDTQKDTAPTAPIQDDTDRNGEEVQPEDKPSDQEKSPGGDSQ